MLDWFLDRWPRIGRYFFVALGIAITILIALLIRGLMRKTLGRRMPKHAYSPLEKLVYYSIIVIGVITSLKPLGLSLSGILLAGGILGIVIGFASQTIISNFLGGLFLYTERPMKIGDPVEVDGVGGEVIDISILSTKIRTWDGYVVRIPNDKVFNSKIANFSKTPARRVEVKVGIAYGSDVQRAKSVILRALTEHPLVLVEPPPEVFVDELGDSAIVLTVRAWAPTQKWFALRTQISELCYRVLVENGIEIPFPQLDVHIR